MASTFALEVSSVTLYKFGSLEKISAPDLQNSINILPQAHEITIFESLHEPVLRARLAMIDMIGLFVNFPITGEEVVKIEYKPRGDTSVTNSYDEGYGSTTALYFVIESIDDINVDPTSRGQAYLINCISIEAFPNVLGTIQEAFEGTIPNIVQNVFDKYIIRPVQTFFPTYKSPTIKLENSDTESQTVIIPNLNPFAALDMLAQLAVPEEKDRSTYLFYQTIKGFKFETLQGIMTDNSRIRFAKQNKYKYFSDEITDRDSAFNNENNIITYLKIQKRYSTLEKVMGGYFNNRRVEINVAQKAIHIEDTTDEGKVRLERYSPNTAAYRAAVSSMLDENDSSNRVKFVVTTHKENDSDFPVSRMRTRWGNDLTTNMGLAQIHLIATIPGTSQFTVGDLFYFEYPDMNSFTESDGGYSAEPKIDDLITGQYLIAEVSHILTIGGYHTTVLGLSKDTYNSTIERRSRYAQ